MNIGLHQGTQCGIHQPVALDPALALERIGHYGHLEMPHAVTGTGVPGMQVTLIFDLQLRRRKRGFEACLNLLNAFCGHGNTSLKGTTLTFRYTPAAT